MPSPSAAPFRSASLVAALLLCAAAAACANRAGAAGAARAGRDLRQLPRHRRPPGRGRGDASAGRPAPRGPRRLAAGFPRRQSAGDRDAPDSPRATATKRSTRWRRTSPRCAEIAKGAAALQSSSRPAGTAWSGCRSPRSEAAPRRRGLRSSAKVVVVGGGYGGATAAKYIRMWSAQAIDVVLVEPQPAFVSCPVIEPRRRRHAPPRRLTTPYDGLQRRHGVTIVRDSVSAIDPRRRPSRSPAAARSATTSSCSRPASS